MYIYLFTDWSLRTILTRSWGRLPKNSIYGTFNKKLLNQTMKNRYSVYKHGDHELQQLLSIADIPLNGHIIEFTDPKDAVWLKLNYENVMNQNKATQMVGLYGPVDIEKIRELCDEFKSRKTTHLNSHNTNHFLKKLSQEINFHINRKLSNEYVTDELNENILATYTMIADRNEILNKTTKDLYDYMNEIQKELNDYLNSIKMM